MLNNYHDDEKLIILAKNLLISHTSLATKWFNPTFVGTLLKCHSLWLNHWRLIDYAENQCRVISLKLSATHCSCPISVYTGITFPPSVLTTIIIMLATLILTNTHHSMFFSAFHTFSSHECFITSGNSHRNCTYFSQMLHTNSSLVFHYVGSVLQTPFSSVTGLSPASPPSQASIIAQWHIVHWKPPWLWSICKSRPNP